ncbi:Serine endopeptidase/trypsin-like serine proteinase family protein [Alcanivorax venustensis ISO4]|jgi:secreted trypsin-like serine protease|uniref:Serine endopeptidase/trypsin-like serine proteinase family protein n=1 Tax=Alloalcanivorax venustensis ISO4 TaxID=1177184 RepID=A0ABS0AJB2_9GAMM|nr:trypsin-like serine protease [Alloalcanivorax venustensis]MBF5054227.1 Serine endopeptidase/trypsin-like serine proteinase family protein [Alloalcanivorax venustensis ISO4]MTI50278.1 trypsin-like serine protease [Alcanivorax sp.]
MVRRLITRAALPALLLLGAAAGAQEATPRIIGGDDATGDWPWAALIEIDTDPSTRGAGYCSGMALTDQLVVTAAHCFFDDQERRVTDPDVLTVWIGSGPGPLQSRSVSAFELPAVQTYADALFDVGQDIALLRLSSPVSLNTFPSLVDESRRQSLEALDQSRADEALTAIGWGITSPNSNDLADTLQEVQLDYVPFSVCDQAWSFQLESGQMLCAAELNPVNQQRQDTCQGDSGGPLFLGEDPAPYVIGLTSFGTPDCASQRPTVYTDVSGQIDFIENAGVTLGEPLVDLNFTTGRDRYYTAPDSSVTITASLVNDSLIRTVSNPSFSYTDSGLDVTANWSGCSGSNPCEVAAELSPEASRSGNFEVGQSVLSASPHRGVLSISSSSGEDDYRIKNNDREIPVIFSDQADLSVTARRVVAEADSANNGQATIEITVTNLSYLTGAIANQVELNVAPPSDASIVGSSANCQSDPCILVSSLGPEQEVTARFTLSTSTPRESTFSATVSAENGDFPTDNNSASVTFNYAGQQATSSSDGGGGGGGGGALGALLALIALAGLRRHL